MTTEEKYAEKIGLLLAKAESTTPEEAELLLAKAQELMTQYAISEALIDQARGIETDVIETRRMNYGGPYSPEKGTLAYVVLRANNCRGLYSRNDGGSNSWYGSREINGKTYKTWYSIESIGFRSDLNRVEMLDTSLQLQMAQALNAWWKEEDRSWMSKAENVRARKSFMTGFAAGVGNKLAEATRLGREAAARDESVRSEVSEEEGAGSVALVLRSRKDRVDEWIDEKYGKLGRGRSSYKRTDGTAYSSGSSAGRRADVGQGRVGSRKEISR